MWYLIPIAGIAVLFYPRKNASGKTTSIAGQIFGPFLPYGPFAMYSDTSALILAKNKIIAAEGRKNTAYLDSRGVLTVGIGHKVVPGDNIKLGQTISEMQVDAFFDKDIAKAFSAAKQQAAQLNKVTPDFVAALTSVNFQLGTGWTNVFPNTWADLKKDNEQSAINRLKQSDWYSQTPQRVAAFIQAIQTAYA